MFDHPDFLRRVVLLDALTGGLSGLLLTFASKTLSAMTGLSAAHLTMAGLSLFPIAAFMAFVGSRRPIPATGVALIIAGNVAWVLGSVAAIAGAFGPLTTFGIVFVAVQAAAVATLALLEAIGLSKLRSA